MVNPIQAEFESLVVEKEALEVASWTKVLEEASAKDLEVERLPSKMVEKLVVMEAPSVFTRLNLMQEGEVLVVRKAMYGLVTSPRDWCTYRDTVLPGIKWQRTERGCHPQGWFEQTKEENLWRLMWKQSRGRNRNRKV